MKPSQFKSVNPMDSIFKKSEHETIIRNALIISVRLGDNWGLTKEQYESERLKDGGYGARESAIANEVLPYLKSAVHLSRVSKLFADKYDELFQEQIMSPENLKNGEEQHEYYTCNVTKKKLCQYDYRHTNGQLFSTVAISLAYARSKRDSWLRSMAMEVK